MTEHEVEKQKIFAFASFFPQLFFKGHEDHVYFTFSYPTSAVKIKQTEEF